MPRTGKRGIGPAIDIAGLQGLHLAELRQLWTQLIGTEPLARISRELLARAIAYRLQEQREPGLSHKEQRQLERLTLEMERSGTLSSLAASVAVRPGTRLVREWQGRVHEVIVLEDDYLWKGQRYRSLSEVARQITGTRWSGPRFFGLVHNGRDDAARSSTRLHRDA